MKPLDAASIKGNWATLLLPIDDNDDIDYEQLGMVIDKIIAAKVNGIYSNGTAGEFYNQTEEEFDRVTQILSERCNDLGVPFQIGVSHMSPIISYKRLLRSKKRNPSAFQVILPDWFPTTLEENVVFLKKMAEAAEGIGLVVYNPPHAKKVLEPEDFHALKKEVPEIVGFKTLGGDDDWYSRMRMYCSDLSIFVSGHYLASGIQRGADGAYSNVACLNPGVAQKWYELMLSDLPKALEIEKRILGFLEGYILPYIKEEHYSNQAVDKLLCAIGGWNDAPIRVRWPYRWFSDIDLSRLQQIAKESIPEFFE